MDTITNKDTPPTFPMDDVVFNRLLLPDKYINSYSEDEFYAFMSKQNRVNIKRFYDQQNQKKINESRMNFEKCKAISINGKRCTHNAKPGCEGYCLKHYKVHVASKYVKIN